MKKLVLCSRSYCHLCDDMLLALESLRVLHQFDLDLIDIDVQEQMLAQYDELVPVLLGRMPDGSLQELCHYYLDVEKVQAFLSQ